MINIRHQGAIVAAVALAALCGTGQAMVTDVFPRPGTTLSPGQNIRLTLSPPMTQGEFNQLDHLIEIRDEERGRLYWTRAAVGNPPYSTIFLLPNEDVRPWSAGGTVRLEMLADSSLADSIALQVAHFRWPLLCDDCEWLGERTPWPLPLLGLGSETLDMQPIDLNRDGLLDMSLARRDLLVHLGLDTCAAHPRTFGLGGEPLQAWSLDHRLSAISLGTSGGMLHPGEGMLVHTRGQDEGVRILARSGPDNTPVFAPLLLEDGSYAGSPKLAAPIRMEPDHLCQDVLVATRGGDLVLFPAADDCSQVLPDSARVVAGGLGDPLALLITQGESLRPGASRDYIMVLEASDHPLRCLVWNGSTLTEAWIIVSDTLAGMEHLASWSDHDDDSRPDLVAWNSLGQVAVLRNIDVDLQRMDMVLWSYPEPLRDVTPLPGGGLILAGTSSISTVADPYAGVPVPFIDTTPALPRRLRVMDLNADGDNDLVVLYQDGQLLGYLDEPAGAARVELPERLVWSGVAVGDTLRQRVVMRHRGVAGLLRIDLAGPPADPAFPFSWPDLPPTDVQPGDSLVLELLVHPGQEMDDCWNSAQFSALWSFPACLGQSGQVAVELCLQAGIPLAVVSADSLDLGRDCGGHAGCEPQCPSGEVWLRNDGSASLRLWEPQLATHPDDSLSAPESFCLLEWPQSPIAAGDSARLRLSYCPPMTEPWPWRQGAMLRISTNVPGADSLLQLPVLGLLECLWPPLFTDDLPVMTEDLPAWIDLEPIITDPDNDVASLLLVVHGVTGAGGQQADSLLLLEDSQGLRLRLRPGPQVNSVRYPQLGLDLQLEDPSGNVTRDTLLCRILPVDDTPAWTGLPDTLLVVREGRTLRLPFSWREVDGDPLLRNFALYRDAGHQQEVESFSFAGEGQWLYQRTLAEGDSALYGGRLWWAALLEDTQGTQGYRIEAAGRLDITSRRDTLRMVEDQELVLNLADWLLSPGEAADDMTAQLLGIFGTGGLPVADVLEVEDLGSLLFRLRPAPDMNRGRVPGLGLLFELSEAQATRRDTLQVAIAPVDDAPRAVLRPDSTLTLPEGQETALGWELAEVDGESFTGELLLGHHPLFADTLLRVLLTPQQPRVDLAYMPEVGDSLRMGGRLHWRLSASDLPPGSGSLLLQQALAIRQSPQDLQLSLSAALPPQTHVGDTLAIAPRVFSATGYVGSLVLRLQLDLREVARIEWPWIDLDAGAVLDTTLILVMPLQGAQSCWTLGLHAGNPAEDPADNALEDCITLVREPLGTEWTAFSPNGDGIHDHMRFLFSAQPPARGYRVEIFDAGGRRVVAHDLASGMHEWSWDGRSGGRELLPGVYAWVQLDGERILARGQLGVVR